MRLKTGVVDSTVALPWNMLFPNMPETPETMTKTKHLLNPMSLNRIRGTFRHMNPLWALQCWPEGSGRNLKKEPCWSVSGNNENFKLYGTDSSRLDRRGRTVELWGTRRCCWCWCTWGLTPRRENRKKQRWWGGAKKSWTCRCRSREKKWSESSP